MEMAEDTKVKELKEMEIVVEEMREMESRGCRSE